MRTSTALPVQPFSPADLDDLPIDDPIAELEAIEHELQRRAWLADPDQWARERLGVRLWSKQRRIAYAVRDFRKTLAMSCHSVGKSFDAALIGCWWIDVHPLGSAFVITSAPSGAQVEAILWREMRRLHAKGKLPGRMNQTEWYVAIDGKEELVAMGRKPDDYNPSSFQGIHARYVLVILDEGCGIRGALWDAADSLTANDDSKIFSPGNPDDPGTEFFQHARPGSGWRVEGISAFDSPNFTGEQIHEDPSIHRAIASELIGARYVEERRKKWAPSWFWVNAKGEQVSPEQGVKCVPPPDTDARDTNPLWQSKILGRFPERVDANGLIPLSWVTAAQQRTLTPGLPAELGQDVGGGGDSSTQAHRRGGVVRVIHEDHNPDTMQTCGRLIETIARLEISLAKVDDIGIGRGVVDRAKEQNKPVVGIGVGSAPWPAAVFDYEEGMAPERFINLRAQLYWWLRTLFERDVIDIDADDEDLAAQLVELRYKRLSSGKIQIESKDEMKRRGVPSPNRAESVMLAVAPRPPEQLSGALTW